MFCLRMTAVRMGLWLKTLSALTSLLWPPNKTSADSKWMHFCPFSCRWRRCSAETHTAEGTCDSVDLVVGRWLEFFLLQALYPHHGLPAWSGPVDRGEDSQRVSVCCCRGFYWFYFIDCFKFSDLKERWFPTVLTCPHKTKQCPLMTPCHMVYYGMH